jgi:glycosyltransferase involved in cell wall biosynthesis
MSPPTVSIVTPSFNQAAFLDETIASVLDQDHPRVEYIVVDDGSTDQSVEIIRKYGDRLSAVIRETNAGQSAALNRGFSTAGGEYLGYLNSDDTLLPGAISAMAAELERDPNLLLVYGDAVYTDASSRHTGYLAARDFDIVAMVRDCDNHVVQPSTLWRREAWERFGPFDEAAWYFFDFEFFLRFPPERVRRIARPLSTYRIHPAAKSTGARGVRLAQDHARLAETFFRSERLPAAARQVARRGRASAYLLGSEFAYEALDLRLARKYVLTGLRLRPAALASPRWLSLAAKTLLPRRLVSRLRARRRSPLAARA